LASDINELHGNIRYLPGIPLPPNLRATSDFDAAVAYATKDRQAGGLIILGVPVAGLASTCARLADTLAHKPHGPLSVVCTCKGFEQETGRLPHQIVQAVLPENSQTGLGVLSGPSFADEVARGL